MRETFDCRVKITLLRADGGQAVLGVELIDPHEPVTLIDLTEHVLATTESLAIGPITVFVHVGKDTKETTFIERTA